MKKLFALMTVLAFALTFSFAAIAADKPAAPAADRTGAAAATADKPATEAKADGEKGRSQEEEGPGQEEG